MGSKENFVSFFELGWGAASLNKARGNDPEEGNVNDVSE